MNICSLTTWVIGDGPEVNPDQGGIEPMACLEITTDEGVTGLSEIFRVPPGVAQAVLGGPDTFFGRMLIGQTLTHPERLWQQMWDALVHTNRRGWEIILLGAIDVALWDIYGKALSQPVWRLLGGSQRNDYETDRAAVPQTVVPYATLVSDSWGDGAMVRQQAARAASLAERGFHAFKAEPLRSSPELIVRTVREVRHAIGPDRTLMLDVGYRFNNVAEAARLCHQLEAHDVFFLETPFPVNHPAPYAELAARTRVPLAMGEHAVTRWEVLDFMDRGRVQVVQPYMTTCGGLTEAKRIVDLAAARGVLVCPGNWSSAILGAATVHLAAYSSVTPFIEYAPAEVLDSPLRTALQERGLPVVAGRIAFPETSGIGFNLTADAVRRWRLG